MQEDALIDPCQTFTTHPIPLLLKEQHPGTPHGWGKPRTARELQFVSISEEQGNEVAAEHPPASATFLLGEGVKVIYLLGEDARPESLQPTAPRALGHEPGGSAVTGGLSTARVSSALTGEAQNQGGLSTARGDQPQRLPQLCPRVPAPGSASSWACRCGVPGCSAGSAVLR